MSITVLQSAELYTGTSQRFAKSCSFLCSCGTGWFFSLFNLFVRESARWSQRGGQSNGACKFNCSLSLRAPPERRLHWTDFPCQCAADQSSRTSKARPLQSKLGLCFRTSFHRWSMAWCWSTNRLSRSFWKELRSPRRKHHPGHDAKLGGETSSTHAIS